MYQKLFAVATSSLFVLLMLFPSLGMESNTNVYEGLEKEIVESSGKVAIKESEETIAQEAKGFEIIICLSSNKERFNPAFYNKIIPSITGHLFLTCCSLQI